MSTMNEHHFLRHRMQQPTPPVPPNEPPVPPRPPAPPRAGSWTPSGPRPADPGRLRPRRGWRRTVLTATRGLVNPGPSAAERQEAELEAAVQAGLRGTYKVGVLGKGGVGKTSIAASVGSILAELRRADRVVALDADTAFGRLGSRIDPEATDSYGDVASDRSAGSFAEVATRVGNNAAGLYVLVGEPVAGRRRVLDPALYREAVLRLDRHFTMSVIDCGSTMDAAVTQEALRDLDALIVVSSPWADGAAAAARTLQWLAERGLHGLLQRTVLVFNDSDGHADKRTRSALSQRFAGHGQAVVEVPFDPHLRPGGVIDVATEMAPATRRGILQVAAIIVRYFALRP
jgi:MinD-like ATPase involved in chromosome partitioning or flagellar assembly